MSIQAVNDSNFEEEVVNADGPVLVDFWAEWCGPCRALMPVVEEIAGEMADKVKIVKVNIDEATQTPGKYGLRGIPTLMLFKDGNVVDTRVGSLPKTQLTEWVEGNL
ncbi:MAG: thioredoxin [Alphaproteobacteria bacterium]|nr:thioredoxin [Alphaproteobacteria bacterium]